MEKDASARIPLEQEIEAYTKILKNLVPPYSVREVSRIATAFGLAISTPTFIRASKPPNLEKGYRMSEDTRKEVADVFRQIIRSEARNHPKLIDTLKGQKLDVRPKGDYTDLHKTLTPEQVTDRIIAVRLGHVPTTEASELISWKVSADLERNAANVDVITANLNWAASHIDDFIAAQGSSKNLKRHVRLLLLSAAGVINKQRIEARLETAMREKKKGAERIEVRDLYSGKNFEYMRGTFFPLGFDIAVYHHTYFPGMEKYPKTIAVMGHTPVNPPSGQAIDDQSNWDRFLNDVQVGDISRWFELMWKIAKPSGTTRAGAAKKR